MKEQTTEQNEPMNKKQLALPTAQITLADLQTMALSIAKSRMFGVTDEHQALALMLLCQAEGIHPILALRRYHIIEGRPSYRADALQGEFEKIGAILWHSRTDQECAATFFADKGKVAKDSITRAKQRYKRLKENGPIDDLAELGELTIIRTIEDAMKKRLAMSWDKDATGEGVKRGAWVLKKNWKQSPRQMLHARCLTEGVRAIAPGLIAGVSTEDEIIDMRDDAPTNGNGATMTAEDRVRQSTANSAGGEAQEAEVVNGQPKPEPAPPITEVTEFNWRDVVCHIGKIPVKKDGSPGEPRMLGKKVGELPPAIIDWMLRKFIPQLAEPVSAQDAMLKTAVEFAARQPRTALWLKFPDEWAREDFFDAMKANKVFDGIEPAVTKFDEIPEDKAVAFLSRFDEAMKIVDDHNAAQKANQTPAKKS